MGHAAPMVARHRPSLNRRRVWALTLGPVVGWACSACAPRPCAEIPPWLAAQVQVERNEPSAAPRLQINMQMRGSAPNGFFTVPFEMRDENLILREVHFRDASARRTRRRASPVLDTGSQGAVLLSRSGATQYRPWLSAQVGASSSIGALGHHESFHGALGGIQLAGMTLEPVPVSVSSRNSRAYVGMGLLSLFEGVIIDWSRGRLHLVARRSLYSPSDAPSRAWLDSLKDRAEWSVAPLEINLDAVSSESLRQVIISTSGALPKTTLRVGDDSYTALIDTGFTGDVLLCAEAPWPLGAGTTQVMADISGRRATLSEHPLLAPLVIGECRFREVRVASGWNPPPGVAAEFEAVIGIGLLRRAPVWLDWQGGALRIWTGRGPFPNLAADDSP